MVPLAADRAPVGGAIQREELQPRQLEPEQVPGRCLPRRRQDRLEQSQRAGHRLVRQRYVSTGREAPGQSGRLFFIADASFLPINPK
jgi:hypothetical protein